MAPSLSLVVPCASKKHKVRLDPKRFWRSKADPTRVRRVVAMVRIAYRLSAPKPAARRTIWLSWMYLAVLWLTWPALWRLSDVWWPMTVLLFGPRWLVLLPAVILVPAAAIYHRRSLIPLALAIIVGVGPIMGFRVGWRGWLGGESTEPIRVATFNAKGGTTLNSSLPWIIDRLGADVLVFQECGGRLAEVVTSYPDTAWHTHSQEGLCLVSRFPVVGVAQMEREHFRFAGGAGVVIRYELDVHGRIINFTNLHLETPRSGLEQLRQGDMVEAQRNLDSKSALRDIESRQARRWVDAASGPSVVVGDFNLPIESAIYGRYWGDLRNCFSRVGFGFGYTRITRWVRARIDHVIVDSEWTVHRAFVGPDFGSDHLPMVADIALATPSR
jgi:endonuclease/exonuclease/phosphatase (EEP) superfamily protein YafD